MEVEFDDPKIWWPLFLNAFSECGDPTEAAKIVGVNFIDVIRYSESTPELKSEFDLAAKIGSWRFVSLAIKWGTEGIEQPVYRDHVRVGTIKKPSEKMLMFVIQSMNPDFRPAKKHTIKGDPDKPVQVKHSGAVDHAEYSINLESLKSFQRTLEALGDVPQDGNG
jgi:hypothetical protein